MCHPSLCHISLCIMSLPSCRRSCIDLVLLTMCRPWIILVSCVCHLCGACVLLLCSLCVVLISFLSCSFVVLVACFCHLYVNLVLFVYRCWTILISSWCYLYIVFASFSCQACILCCRVMYCRAKYRSIARKPWKDVGIPNWVAIELSVGLSNMNRFN